MTSRGPRYARSPRPALVDRPDSELAQLALGYRRCAAITRRHATTYFWGTALLPVAQRRHVYAVYALCRRADDIVDEPAGFDHAGVRVPTAVGSVTSRLAEFATQFEAGLAGVPMADPVLAAVVHTTRTCGIDPACFDRFFAAMAMDLTRSSYDTFAELCGYMDGSAAVIGEMMLPVLAPHGTGLLASARSLGLAFQLTNFLRDVAEDLDRGRVYLPQREMQDYGVRLDERRATPEWQRFMAFQIGRTRELYRDADEGLVRLPTRAARCVRTARVLYAQILDRIEAAGYDVFSQRLRVPTAVKAATAARHLVRIT